MNAVKTLKLLGTSAIIALTFAANAHAVEVTEVETIDADDMSAVCPPVPEADTWAMMALGLGTIGLVLRRKSKKSQDAAK